MKWLSNTHDPSSPDWTTYIHVRSDQSWESAIDSHMDWLEDKIIGEPQATNRYSVEELKQMGMVGVYTKDSE